MRTLWRQLSPSTPPPVRGGGAMGLNRNTNKVLLFGGYNFPALSAAYNDTWEYDGATQEWTELFPASPPTPPVTSPTTFLLGTGDIGWDPFNTMPIMVIGQQQASPGTGKALRFFHWTGTNWSELFPATPPPAQSLDAGWLWSYDESLGRLFLLGAGTGEVYEWDGTDFTDTGLNPGVGTIHYPSFTYDRARQLSYYYGGFNINLPPYPWDLYSFDGTAFTFQDDFPASQPSARGMPGNGRYTTWFGCADLTVLYGQTFGMLPNDFGTYKIVDDPANPGFVTWVLLDTAGTHPSNETLGGLVDDGHGGVLYFGGSLNNDYSIPYTNQTWRLACSADVQVMRWW